MVANYPVVADSLTLYLAEIVKFKILNNDERFHAEKFFEEKDLESAHTLITANLRRRKGCFRISPLWSQNA
jgi:RNA polymerase sigma-32 factor